MRTTTMLLLAALLGAAACERQPDAEPPGAPAPQDHIPEPAAGELPAPDTLAPGQPPPPTSSANSPDAAAPAPDAPSRTATPPAAGEPQSAGAQQDGAAVLQRASTAYAGVRSMKANFVMLFNNPLLRQQSTSRGTLYQRRPDRIALRFSDPAGDVLLSDGQDFWIYYPSLDVKQVIRCPASAGGQQGVDLQAQFVGDPVRRFRYTVHGQESVGGRTADVLTLEPREETDYQTLKVWFDTRDALARRFEITERNGNVRRFDLNDFEVNPSVPDAIFRFTPPEGARIVGCS